jgi:uncharacterized protein YbjT (DUF2867 family)
MNENRILVIGATGNVGRQVVAELVWTGQAVRALARDPDRADLPGDVEVVRGDLADPETVRAAAKGVDAVFLMWPFFDTSAAPAVLDALDGRVVYLSAEDTRTEPGGPIEFHRQMERLVRRTAPEWTILRPGGFATNTLMWADQIRAGGVVRWPYAAATRTLIDERDIAAVAARALTEAGHHGATYVLSGPEPLTQADQVRIIGEAIGRPARFEEIAPEVARGQLIAKGWPEVFADGTLQAWANMVDTPESVSPTVREVTGQPARSFRDWALHHAEDFR